MKKLTLTSHVQGSATLLENEFIDDYMPKANGEYIKVYLLLLRYLNDATMNLTISKIADMLDHTEKDVIRALNYWKGQGLLDFETKEQVVVSAVSETVPASVAPVRNITQFKNQKELKELLFVAEQYLGKTLSATDIDALSYFYDTLSMSTDLIEYLIEYCVENGHKSIHYIQKVAISWADKNIKTVQDAKMHSVAYNKNCYSVLNAFGIKGRAPASSELIYIRRWNEEYGLSLELITEACNRTMNAIHQPNFEYTESILKNWMQKGVRHLKDIEAVDIAHRKEKESRQHVSTPVIKSSQNKFNNFEGRTYDNMDDLERQLIQSQ